MGWIGGNLIHQSIHSDPLSKEDFVPSVVKEPTLGVEQTRDDPGRNARSPGEGGKKHAVFIAVSRS